MVGCFNLNTSITTELTNFDVDSITKLDNNNAILKAAYNRFYISNKLNENFVINFWKVTSIVPKEFISAGLFNASSSLNNFPVSFNFIK